MVDGLEAIHAEVDKVIIVMKEAGVSLSADAGFDDGLAVTGVVPAALSNLGLELDGISPDRKQQLKGYARQVMHKVLEKK